MATKAQEYREELAKLRASYKNVIEAEKKAKAETKAQEERYAKEMESFFNATVKALESKFGKKLALKLANRVRNHFREENKL